MICSASRRVYYVHNPISMETPEGSATAKLSESEHSRIDLNYGRSLRSLYQLDCSSARTHGTVAFSGSLPCLLLFQPDFTLLCHLSTPPFRFCMLPLPHPIGSSLAYRLTWFIPLTVSTLSLDLDDLISGRKGVY